MNAIKVKRFDSVDLPRKKCTFRKTPDLTPCATTHTLKRNSSLTNSDILLCTQYTVHVCSYNLGWHRPTTIVSATAPIIHQL